MLLCLCVRVCKLIFAQFFFQKLHSFIVSTQQNNLCIIHSFQFDYVLSLRFIWRSIFCEIWVTEDRICSYCSNSQFNQFCIQSGDILKMSNSFSPMNGNSKSIIHDEVAFWVVVKEIEGSCSGVYVSHPITYLKKNKETKMKLCGGSTFRTLFFDKSFSS